MQIQHPRKNSQKTNHVLVNEWFPSNTYYLKHGFPSKICINMKKSLSQKEQNKHLSYLYFLLLISSTQFFLSVLNEQMATDQLLPVEISAKSLKSQIKNDKLGNYNYSILKRNDLGVRRRGGRVMGSEIKFAALTNFLNSLFDITAATGLFPSQLQYLIYHKNPQQFNVKLEKESSWNMTLDQLNFEIFKWYLQIIVQEIVKDQAAVRTLNHSPFRHFCTNPRLFYGELKNGSRKKISSLHQK